jgi:hypothetical protein
LLMRTLDLLLLLINRYQLNLPDAAVADEDPGPITVVDK